MNSRVKQLRDGMSQWDDTVCVERARIVTKAYQEHDAEPMIIRRAEALRAVLEQMPIYMRDGDLIVGTPTSTPGAWIAYPEFSMGTEQIVQNRHNFSVGKDFIKNALPEDVKDYWSTRNLYANYAKYRREECGDDKPPPENWYRLSTALGHITPDFAEVVEHGLKGVIEQASRRLEELDADDQEGAEFLRAVTISARSGIAFAERYGELARQEASQTDDAERKSELLELADGLGHAMANGARTFWEAIQCVWLCNQIMHIEGNAWSMSPGRVDKLLFPYYDHDIDNGLLTRERALELIECFLIKFKENTVFGPRGNLTQCLTLAGSTADGVDASNELTFLFLEATANVRLAEPLVFLRWHRGISDKLMDACFDCTASGQNMPVFLNDEGSPGGFINLGISRDAAYDFTHVGCGELGITGKLQDSALGGTTGHVSTLTQMLRQNSRGEGKALSRLFPTFDDLVEGLGKKMRANAEAQALQSREVGAMQAKFGQIPFTSAFMHGCIDRARDLTVRAEYNFPNMNMGAGYSNFVSSMAAIRKLVYRDQLCDLDELFAAMDANFEGYEDLLAAARRAPKFGNDDNDADGLIPVLEQLHADAIAGLEGPRNRGRFITSGIDGANHMAAGAHLMATPDGRLKGQPLSPGMSAGQGVNQKGLTALLNTVQKLDSQNHWFGGYTINIRVTPDMLKTADSRDKMRALLRVHFMGKALNLHLNCVSTETLREAQEHPEQYRDLVVRVAGYSEHFGKLSREFQDEIISRNEEAG